MTPEDKFKVEHTLQQIENILVNKSNTCELEFFMKLKKNLMEQLEEE